jgi:hypothetical protein
MDPGRSSSPRAEIGFTVCLQLLNVNVWRNEIGVLRERVQILACLHQRVPIVWLLPGKVRLF